MADPLHTLARLNRLALDQAQIALAEKRAALAEAEAAADTARATLSAELAAAHALGAVQAFAAWLPAARRHIAACDAAIVQRQSEADNARAALATARTEAETVGQLIANKAKRRRAGETRQEALDAWPPLETAELE